MTSVISGVRIPDSKLAREAAELVRSYEDEMLFNHSVRVFVSCPALCRASTSWFRSPSGVHSRDPLRSPGLRLLVKPVV